MNKREIAIDLISVIIGSVMLSIGINMFLVPNEIAAGGVSGIATVLYLSLGVPMSLTVLTVNGFLFVLGWKTLRKWELIKSLLGVIFLSFFLQVLNIFPGYTEDIFIAAIFGGILCGLGIGITVHRGASTGGSDMAALIASKKFRGISVATFIMIFDGGVILASGYAFSSVTIMLYAVVSAYISVKVTDFITVNGDNAKQLMVMSSKIEQIGEKVMAEIGRGATGIYSRGLYTKRDGMSLLCVVRRGELHRVLKIVKEQDPDAFVTVGEVRQVIGEGFKRME